MGRKQKLKQQRKIENLQKQKAKKKKTALLVYIFLAVVIAVIALIIFLVKDNPTAQDDGLFDSNGGLMDVNEDSLNEISDQNSNSSQADALVTDKTEVVEATMKTAKGDIRLSLYPKNAPNTVANFVKLANQDFYDGITFHRVVPDFIIQGGDPLSKDDNPNNDGTGGPGYSFADEINPWSLGLSDEQISGLEQDGYQYTRALTSLPNVVGAIAMANSGPNTNGSQFFIITKQDQPFLNGKHTVFGKVTDGMDVVRSIERGDKILDVVISE